MKFIIFIIIAVVIFAVIMGIISSKDDNNTHYNDHSYHDKDIYNHNPGIVNKPKAISDDINYFEEEVNEELENRLYSYDKIIRNAYIPTYNGKTTEVDFIIINNYGIFVVECKSFKGYIEGDADEENWTKTSYYNNESFVMYNPVKQNNTHIKFIKKTLNRYDLPCYSIIVFSNNTTLNIDNVDDKTYIVFIDELVDTINEIKNENHECLSEKGISYIYNKLAGYANVSDNVKEKHIEDIHNDHGYDE